jgi:prepilin-type processing-associated H-X9-DG protein
MCFGGLANINDPSNIPPPTADPFTVAPEYGGTCGAVAQAHNSMGRRQRPGNRDHDRLPPNKGIIGMKGEGDLDLTSKPFFAGGPMFAAISTSSFHPSGVNALLADGSVRFYKSSITGTVWRARGTVQGGEVIGADFY